MNYSIGGFRCFFVGGGAVLLEKWSGLLEEVRGILEVLRKLAACRDFIRSMEPVIGRIGRDIRRSVGVGVEPGFY